MKPYSDKAIEMKLELEAGLGEVLGPRGVRWPFYHMEESSLTTTYDFLYHVEPPWVYVGSGEPERKKWVPSHFYSRQGVNVCVRRLRGTKMQTTPALMNEFGASLQFFDEFGENWTALAECLAYLDEWLPAEAYILVMESAESVLQNEQPDQMAALLKTLHEAGEWWAQPITENDRFNRKATPFHVLLHVTENQPQAMDRIVRVADEADIPIRRSV